MSSSTATIPHNTVSDTDMIDYYYVLKLERQWDLEKLRSGLKKALAEAQSRINAAKGENKERIERRIVWIRSARKIFTDLESKAKYDRELAEYERTATPEQKASAAGILTISELWALIDTGRYLDAAEAGKRLVNHEPKNDRAWEVYGYASYQWKDINTAIYAAEQAIQCNPRNAEYYSDAGGYLAAADRWDDAIVQLNKAIQLEPTNISYKLTLSNIHVQHESWDDAEAILKGVLSQEPSNQIAQSFMAIVIHDRAIGKIPQVDELAHQGKKKEARKLLKEIKDEFEKAQKLVENDPDMRELLTSNSIGVRRALGVNSYQRIFGFLLDSLFTLPGILLLCTGKTIAVVGGCIYLVVVLGYSWVYLAAKNNGQDLTKRISGMQIINDDSNSYPGVEKLIFRAILKPITLAAIFMAIVLAIIAAYIPTMFESDGFKVAGMIIGLIIFFTFGIFRMLWELLFITDKDLAPGLLGFVLFLHDKLTKTTVACSARDSIMNFSSYKWYGNSKEKIILLITAGLTIAILAISGFSLWKEAGQQSSQEIINPSSAPPIVDSSQKEQTSTPSNNGDSNPSTQQSTTPATSSPTTISSPSTSITKEDAVSLVKRWLNARSQMFAPPYNQEVGRDLATGKAYSDKVHGPSSDGTDTSTLEWLRKFDYYYAYNSTDIGEIISFRESGDEIILDMVVTDDRTQYDNKRKVVSKNSGKTKSVIRYRLKYDSDKWKISDIEELQKIVK
jgi:tetratricopeptide (TPR) repeat protein